MDILHSNDGLTVVERWLRKLIESNDEHDRRYRIGKYKREEKPERQKPRKPRQQKVLAPEPEPKPEPRKVEEKRGYVYLMRSGNGYHKIGITKNIKNRLYGVRVQFPIAIDVIHYIASEDYRNVERFLHNKYSSKRVQHEWFSLNEKDISWFKSLRDHELDPLC
jgi:predicted GIY-YIG superfamily endonuclease